MGGGRMLKQSGNLSPEKVLQDSTLSFLAPAFSDQKAIETLRTCLALPREQRETLRLKNIQVLRHKVGRRCLIAYDLEQHQGDRILPLRVLGKVRAKGFDQKSYALQGALFASSFNSNASDQIAVPQPLGAVPQWKMWLQARVPGTPITDRLVSSTQPLALETMGRMAEVIHKLHQTNLATNRCHDIEDELTILRDRLYRVTQTYPHWHQRIEKLLQQCDQLAAFIEPGESVGIHRDYYPDQVLADGNQLYLLDLDLYCRGDPNLDVGNFIGHLTELGLRKFGDPAYFQSYEQAIAKRFLEISSQGKRINLQIYTTLTLVRHIFISTQISPRQHTTPDIFDLCESRITQILAECLGVYPGNLFH